MDSVRLHFCKRGMSGLLTGHGPSLASCRDRQRYPHDSETLPTNMDRLSFGLPIPTSRNLGRWRRGHEPRDI
jgi:hypothetical protein